MLSGSTRVLATAIKPFHLHTTSPNVKQTAPHKIPSCDVGSGAETFGPNIESKMLSGLAKLSLIEFMHNVFPRPQNPWVWVPA